MIQHAEIADVALRGLIRSGKICFGGNSKLKIYGLLNCSSGKRMKKENRVFFTTQQDAQRQHYRPCGNCMRVAYKKWKDGLV